MPKTLSSQIQYLLQVWPQRPKEWTSKEIARIQVNKMIGSIAWVYEKFRNIVDMREDHLLRKNAIERILKRRLMLKEKTKDIPKPLIEELIRAGYLKNNTVPENKIPEVQAILNKYIDVIKHLPDHKERKYTRKDLTNWLLDLAACEIEENLTIVYREKAIIDVMYDIINPRLKFKEKYPQHEQETQVYLAINRALVKSDHSMIAYLLFKLYHPEWENPSPEMKAQITNQIVKLKKAIDGQVKHPLSERLWRMLARKSVPFYILKEVLNRNKKDLNKIVASPDLLEEKIREITQDKYHKTRSRLTRGIIRAILYIFVTKSIFALILEVPFEWYITGHLDYRTLGINLVFQPILMFIIALTIRVPSEKNTLKIISEIKNIVYGYPKDQIIHFKAAPTRSFTVKFLFAILYTIVFAISFGLVISCLYLLHFNIFSGVVFIFFLCLVSFFGFKLRSSARELVVLERKESWLTFLVDFLSIPLVRAGRWMSLNISKINIFTFFLDFIFEAPFKIFLEVLEDFFSYIREKRDEVY